MSCVAMPMTETISLQVYRSSSIYPKGMGHIPRHRQCTYLQHPPQMSGVNNDIQRRQTYRL